MRSRTLELAPGPLKTAALVATLLVPLGLLHAFVLAEVGIAVTDILFIAHSLGARDFAWARWPWFIAAMLWWAWLVLCSLPLLFPTAGWAMGFLQALVIIRLILFTAALQNWVLTTAPARRAVWFLLALSCLWIGVECWQQYLTGHNIFGNPRNGDGALTGPFWKPRAGQLYAHLLLTALLPPFVYLAGKPGRPPRIAAVALAIIASVTSVLIGQRMGLALTFLSLAVAAVFIRNLRRPAAAAIAIGLLALVLTPLISPPTHAKLVGETSRNLHHFAQSPYGELFTRATVMGTQSPVHGWGYNGFRALCPEPRFDQGIPALGIVPTSVARFACNLHPQNYYIQAFVDAGYPGLFLFIASILILTADLGRGLFKNPDPLRVGLFIGILTYTWPIASTDAFPTLYMLGWFFLLLGLGLAATHIQPDSPLASDPQHA